MKGFCVMLSVFIVLMIFVFCEEAYINKTSKDLSSALDFQLIKTNEDLNAIIDEWQCAEKKLKLFINHKELEKITIEFQTTKVFYLQGEDALYKAYLERVKEKLKNLPNY